LLSQTELLKSNVQYERAKTILMCNYYIEFCWTLKFSCTQKMGGCHRAGTGKNKKVIEISPLLAF